VSEQDEVAARCATIASAVAGHGDLDAALADFRRLPDGLPARPRLAAGLVEAIFRTGRVPPPGQANALPALLALADTDPPATPQWRRTRVAAEILTLVQPAMEMRLTDPAGALARLDKLAAEHAGDPGLLTMIDSGRTALGFARAVQDGDAGAMTRLPGDLAQFLGGLPPQTAGRPERDLLTRMTGLLAAQQSGADVSGAFQELFTVAQTLPVDSPVRDAFAEASADLATFATLGGDDSVRPTDDQLAAFVRHAGQPGINRADRALLHGQAGITALWAGRESDPGRLALGIGQLRSAVELTGPADQQRAFYLGMLATGLLRRHEVAGTAADLREAAGLLDEARAVAGGPHHPQWQMINEMLGQVRRLRGDRPDFHEAPVEGLRGTVWQVLVQPDLTSATAVVRRAGAEAIEVARQCLIAGDPAAAISALDAGRGLALFAATFSASGADGLTGQLIEAGEHELAGRWQAAAAARDPAALSADLRREVMTVLARHGAATALLDPPGYAEIQQALTDLDADALVYLMPGEGVRPGHAVIAPAAGPPSFLTLPLLTPESLPDLDKYFSALRRRDLVGADGGTEDDTGDDLEARLTDVGRWAWDAGMRPLIETYLPRLEARPDRPPRVVLIPMGDLARVPWQAAQRPDGRYAIELIAISQVSSARMLVRSATFPAVPLTPGGLIVGDPDTLDPQTGVEASRLPAARLEAYAIRQTFYPGARYLGRRPDGTSSRSGRGTADEIRDWLATAGPAAGALMHLACHGFVQSGGPKATAYLALAGGERLTAEELVARIAGAPDRALSLVVLAACRTGLSLNGYDEAYSLGTAFLAGGVRTVVSSQWSVPDDATSALMFMLHRNLRVAGAAPWAALRDAQLWMLDPDREIADDMPGPLRDQLAGTDLRAVLGWAAFLHWGQ